MSAFWQLLLDWLATGGVFLAWIACVLLCLGGLVLSALSISGTWLVLAAGGVAASRLSGGRFTAGAGGKGQCDHSPHAGERPAGLCSGLQKVGRCQCRPIVYILPRGKLAGTAM